LDQIFKVKQSSLCGVPAAEAKYETICGAWGVVSG
jgi:hypothetical protein